MTLHVCFLWHMHQPSYDDPVSGDVVMPWVRMHGVKDYTDMALAAQAAGARVTFNFVPGLCDQLEAALAPGYDKREVFWRVSLKAPKALTSAELDLLRARFFSLQHANMLEPYPRYVELRQTVAAGDRLTAQDIRDLQVWFNLGWCGEGVRNKPEVAALLVKHEGFDEADKAALLAAQREALGEVIPRYRELVTSGTIELSCSPHYHPILPLLTDTATATMADACTVLPDVRFRWPGDARWHIERGVASHTERFGAPPAGMWPSEGSVTAALVPMLLDSGLRWIATDDAILSKSLGEREPTPAERCRPWDFDGLRVFFRDHVLSDRIGFVYATWPDDAACGDFVARLAELERALDGADGAVTIALDGENCWEHYPSGSLGFLPKLYRAIDATPGLRLSTFSEALEAVPAARTASGKLATGSWIDGTFRTWIGDSAKNNGWELLAAARSAVGTPIRDLAEHDPELADLVMRAEASDWFWWLGEGHSSSFDPDFDLLFRRHLAGIYDHLGLPRPAALEQPVDPDSGSPASQSVQVQAPAHFLRPRITGRDDDYYKWLGAGHVYASHGAMHRADRLIERVDFGFDTTTVSLRVVTRGRAAEAFASGARARLKLTPVDLRAAGAEVVLWPAAALPVGAEAACDVVLEVQVPTPSLALSLERAHRWDIELLIDNAEGALEERFPPSGPARVQLPKAFLHDENWTS